MKMGRKQINIIGKKCVKRGLPEGIAARNTVIARHKHSAKNRGLKWNLTDKQVIAIHKRNCHYCGVPPSNIRTSKNGAYNYNGSYTYSGIDRINNNKGYIINNVVPCCEDCNEAKGEKSYNEFLDLIKRRYFHLMLGREG